MSTFTTPVYSLILTPDNWNKKKGTIAKMAGETGIGASLTKLKKVYDNTNWDLIKVDDRKPKIDDFKLPAWDKLCKEAAALAIKDLAALRKAAYETRDLAKTIGDKFKKNPLIPKDSTKLCVDIATAADSLGVGCNPNSISGYITQAQKAGRAWLDITVKLVEDGTMKKNANIVKAALKGLKKPADWHGEGIKTKCRNVTQILGNAAKAVNAGYPLKISTSDCKKLFTDLVLYADKSEQPFKDDDANGFEDHRKKLSELMDKVIKI